LHAQSWNWKYQVTSQMDKMHLLRMQELEHNSILCQFLSLKKALSQQGTPMDILAMLNTRFICFLASCQIFWKFTSLQTCFMIVIRLFWITDSPFSILQGYFFVLCSPTSFLTQLCNFSYDLSN
jgi:hypothetical protein